MWKVRGVSLPEGFTSHRDHIFSLWANTFNSLAPVGETWKPAWFLLPFLLHFFIFTFPFQPLTAWSPWGEAVVGWIMQSEYTFSSLWMNFGFFLPMDTDSSFCYCNSLLESVRPSTLYLLDFNGCEYSHAFSHAAPSLPTHKIVLVLHAFSWRPPTFTRTL